MILHEVRCGLGQHGVPVLFGEGEARRAAAAVRVAPRHAELWRAAGPAHFRDAAHHGIGTAAEMTPAGTAAVVLGFLGSVAIGSWRARELPAAT